MIDVTVTLRMKQDGTMHFAAFANWLQSVLKKLTHGDIIAVNVEGWYPLETTGGKS